MVDVSDLKNFYRSAYGKAVYLEVSKLLKEFLLPNPSKRLFVGFGVPYTKQYNGLLLMLAHMGIYAWPNQPDNCSALTYEHQWPFSDQEFDEIILLHGLEYSQNANELIDESFRCLKSEGKLIVITPNRRGVWAHNDKTPLGFGKPYSLTQLVNILNKKSFMIVNVKRALYKLPFGKIWGRLFAALFEVIAKGVLQKFSGLVGVVAIKQVYSGVTVNKQSHVFKEFTAPRPIKIT